MNPPDFGPINPPAEARQAGQTERVLKDVLSVGRWKVGYDQSGKPLFWDVTAETLRQILADFKAARAAGVTANLGKTHGDENLLIHPDDLIAPIAELKVAGDTLWMAAYVTPAQKTYLSNPARKVSIGVIPDHADGAGRTYKHYLTHVAVTDRPVVAPQGAFLALADRYSKPATRKPLAMSDAAKREQRRTVAADVAKRFRIPFADALRNTPE